jgi:glycosyltransferase involved in cell wall biosynthesis
LTIRIAQYYPRALSGDGGMTGAIHRLSQSMRTAGADATIICDEGSQPTPTDDGVFWRRIGHHRVTGRTFPDSDQLASALRGSDVVILNSAWAVHNIAAARIARRVGVPYVVAPRGAYDPRIRRRHRLAKDVWWLAAERRLLARSLAVHIFFDTEHSHLERLGYRGNVIVAPNGIDIPTDVCWDGGSNGTVIWLGRFDPEHKGLDLLLGAMHRIPADGRPQLRLCGPDWRGKKATVLGLVARFGLDQWVTVSAPIYGREKLELMARAAAFVYPSRWEGFGNSLAEAAAVGVPALVTPYPLARFLASQRAAVMVEPSAEGLAAGLVTVMSPGSSAVGARARQVMAESFSWSAVALQWLQGIDQALGQ